MLKIEDCKPGVEVIAIKNIDTGSNKPRLSIGMIYTIKKLNKHVLNSKTMESREQPNICVEEVDNSLANPRTWGWSYFLEQFKLRDRDELIKLFKINEIDYQKSRELEEV